MSLSKLNVDLLISLKQYPEFAVCVNLQNEVGVSRKGGNIQHSVSRYIFKHALGAISVNLAVSNIASWLQIMQTQVFSDSADVIYSSC